MRSPAFPHTAHGRAFTLLETLVGMAVFVLLLGMIFAVLNYSLQSVSHANAKIDSFQAARAASDTLTQKLSQATLNTYWDYDNAANPTKYERKSDLDFLNMANGSYGQRVAFQAPLSFSQTSDFRRTQGLLSACSYFVEYGNDDAFRPSFNSTKRWRYRLMQAIEPTEDLAVFKDSSGVWADQLKSWKWPLAENIIAMIVWPRLPLSEDASGSTLAPSYAFDSRSGPPLQQAQLPPIVTVTLVAVTEISMQRLAAGSQAPSVIESALQGKFTDASKNQDDLDALTVALDTAGIRYEILTTSVVMKGAKWSSE